MALEKRKMSIERNWYHNTSIDVEVPFSIGLLFGLTDCEERKIYRNNKTYRRQGRETERSYCYHEASIGAAVPISIGLLFVLKPVAITHKRA